MAYDPTYKDYLLWREKQRQAGTLLKELPKSPPQKAGAWPLQFNKSFSSYDPIDIAISEEAEASRNEFLNLIYSDKSIKPSRMEDVADVISSPKIKPKQFSKKTFTDTRRKAISSLKSKWKGLRPYQKIGIGIGAGLGLYGLAFSGKDDNFNNIEGLHPGSNGLGASVIRSMTDFGSGYKGLPKELMGVTLDPNVVLYRSNIIDEGKQFAIDEEIKFLQSKQTPGSFEKEDYNKRIQLNNFRVLHQLNTTNSNLRQINLDKFKINVEDADTLFLKRKGLSGLFSDDIVVRLAGIDAPETTAHENDPLEMVRYKQSQLGGEEATEKLKELVSKQKHLSLIVSGEKTYGRYVGALTGDESILNVDLARMGAVTSLPFGEVAKDVIFRESVRNAELQAKKEGIGLWSTARYKAIERVREKVGQPITYNTLTRIDKLAQNLNLAAYSSFVEGLGSEKRNLTLDEQVIARRIGYALKKSHGPKKRAYNKFDGLHPGSEGMGAWSMRNHSDFGSGWQGLSKLGRLYNKEDAVEDVYDIYQENKSMKAKAAGQKIDYLLGKETVNNIYQKLGNGLKFSAMPNRGTAAAKIRGQLTEFKEDFASRWDKLKNIASKIYGHTDDAYEKLIQSKEFKQALLSGEKIGELGRGAFGKATKYKAKLGEHEFEYVIKSTLDEHKSIPRNLARGERALKTEAEALKEISGEIMPSLYGEDKGKIFMEYMPGKTAREILESGGTIDVDLKKELETQMQDIAKKGFMNFDINPGNIMYDQETKRLAWIDFGMSMKGIDEKQALDKMKEAFSFNSETWSSVTSKTSSSITKTPIQDIATNDISNFMENFDTNIKSESIKKTPVVSDRQQALKRMKKFNNVAQSAVGSGLKAAHNGGRGHKNFNSGNSGNSSGWNF